MPIVPMGIGAVPQPRYAATGGRDFVGSFFDHSRNDDQNEAAILIALITALSNRENAQGANALALELARLQQSNQGRELDLMNRRFDESALSGASERNNLSEQLGLLRNQVTEGIETSRFQRTAAQKQLDYQETELARLRATTAAENRITPLAKQVEETARSSVLDKKIEMATQGEKAASVAEHMTQDIPAGNLTFTETPKTLKGISDFVNMGGALIVNTTDPAERSVVANALLPEIKRLRSEFKKGDIDLTSPAMDIAMLAGGWDVADLIDRKLFGGKGFLDEEGIKKSYLGLLDSLEFTANKYKDSAATLRVERKGEKWAAEKKAELGGVVAAVQDAILNIDAKNTATRPASYYQGVPDALDSAIRQFQNNGMVPTSRPFD
jgi:hypothetical protein